MDLRELQSWLKKAGIYKGKVDNLDGPKTQSAINTFLEKHQIPFKKWSNARRQLAAKQLVCKLEGIEVGEIDGFFGPQTQYAFEFYMHRVRTGKDPEPWRDEAEKQPPVVKPGKSPWPKQSVVESYYGKIGENQTTLILPFPMRIAWNRAQVITKFSCHQKVVKSATRILTRVADAYDHPKRQKLGLDLFGGCLNVRKMRGGTNWSMHSWGIAIDFDPMRNELKWGRDKAFLARPEAETFWKLWEEEGWLSLGRTRNYDWMHVQAATL